MQDLALCISGSIITGMGIGVEFTPFLGHGHHSPQLGVGLVFIGALTVAVARISAVVKRVNKPADVAYVDGYEAGYDKGWQDGRRVPRMTILPNRRPEHEQLASLQ